MYIVGHNIIAGRTCNASIICRGCFESSVKYYEYFFLSVSEEGPEDKMRANCCEHGSIK